MTLEINDDFSMFLLHYLLDSAMPPQIKELQDLKKLKAAKRDVENDDSDNEKENADISYSARDSKLSIDESGDVDMNEKKDKTQRD